MYAYSVAFGRELGSWAAHDDTVACLQLLSEECLVTASWDCSVKLWRCGHGPLHGAAAMLCMRLHAAFWHRHIMCSELSVVRCLVQLAVKQPGWLLSVQALFSLKLDSGRSAAGRPHPLLSAETGCKAPAEYVSCKAMPLLIICSGLFHGRLGEGRQPWSGAPVLPQAELGEHETGVWALAASADGRTVLTGTDEGAVAAWDLRSRRALWQARRRPMHARKRQGWKWRPRLQPDVLCKAKQRRVPRARQRVL